MGRKVHDECHQASYLFNVSNIDASVAFYEKAFGVRATKRRPDYAKLDLASPSLHGEVLTAMAEEGIDLSSVAPQRLTDELASQATLLVTMGCGEVCPVVPGLRREDWPLEDPRGKPVERVREIRNEVRARVAELVSREGWAAAS
ncbi:VOC family protein [Sorangium sp. So ce367]